MVALRCEHRTRPDQRELVAGENRASLDVAVGVLVPGWVRVVPDGDNEAGRTLPDLPEHARLLGASLAPVPDHRTGEFGGVAGYGRGAERGRSGNVKQVGVPQKR